MDRFDFMMCVKGVLEEVETKDLDKIKKEMIKIIDSMIELENEYDKAGLR